MSDWIDGLCVFSPEQCQLLKDNIDLYVSIAVVTVIMHIGIVVVPDAVGRVIKLILKKYSAKNKTSDKDNC